MANEPFDIVSWLSQNKDWLFNGALVAVPLAILAVFFGKKLDQKTSLTTKGNVDRSPGQSQHDVLTGVQVGGNVTINLGLTLDEMKRVGDNIFDSNFTKLSKTAAAVAHDRASELMDNFLDGIRKSGEINVARAEDPGFQYNLYQAQKQYARSGDPNLQNILVGILIELAASPSRSLLDVSLSEAIDRASKLTAAQMDILAMIFVRTSVSWASIYQNSEFAKFVDEQIQPYLIPELLHTNEFRHLQSLACIDIGPSPHEIEVFFMSNFRTLFSKGIPKDEASKIDNGSSDFWTMFRPFDRDKSLLQLSFQSNELIKQHAITIGLPDDVVRQIFTLDSRYLMKSHEKREFLESLHPCMAKLYDMWNTPNSPLARSNLTTAGIALAHAHIKTHGTSPGPLSAWI